MRSITLILLAIILLAATAFADRITCYTLWDADFFYAAFEVEDPNIISHNTTHMSQPWEDDAVEVFLEVDTKRATNFSPNTYQMSVSAGGGSSFVVGVDGKPQAKRIFTFKHARRVHGTINRPYDRDLGYTIELAIPWREMGGPPIPGQTMGFNVIVRMQGEREGFVSLSPDVQSLEDIHIPAKWARIKFVDTPTIIAMEDGAVVCRKVGRQPPIINGNISPGEWIRDMRFQMLKPPIPEFTPIRRVVEKLSLTPYHYRYHAQSIRREDGSSRLINHPLNGTGPWFSFDQVQWHKDQLTDISNAGIDIILPMYRGSTADRREYSSVGLICLAQALKELKAEGESYPLVGMYFDTSSMSAEYNDTKLDLRDDEVKETFYRMIRDFFLHIPAEFRAVVQTPMLPGETEGYIGGHPAYVVVLGPASWFSEIDAGFIEYCDVRFADEFAGRQLLWVGASDYREKGIELDGYLDLQADAGAKFSDKGWLIIGSVNPGYDETATGKASPRIRPRLHGQAYKNDWDDLIPKSADWVVIDSWNDFFRGSGIAPTAEYGIAYLGQTRINMLRFNGMRHHDAKFIRHDTPSAMLPGALYQVTLTIRNAGTRPWYPGVFLAGRWFKDGAIYADSGLRLPFQGTILAGQVVEKTVGIRTVDQDGHPLPEGEYELRWEMVRGVDDWFSVGGDTPLCVPVSIVNRNDLASGFSVVSSTLPALVKSGASYDAALSLRNEGPDAWPAGTKIAYRWHKLIDSEDVIIGGDESAAVLAGEVLPGRIARVDVPVAVRASDGSPIPVLSDDDDGMYVLRWEVLDENGPATGIGHCAEAVRVLSEDHGVKFLASNTPAEMSTGRAHNVSLTVANHGVEPLTKADYSIGYRWYHLDGIEAGSGAETPLPSDVCPGETANVQASVAPPTHDGRYYLVWELMHGDTLASSGVRGGDMLVVPVNVVNGRLAVQDLDDLFDVDVISFDEARTDGDADGGGSTLPAEFLPPPASIHSGAERLWPSGLWNSSTDSDSSRVSFKFPSKADGANNAVSCNGQSIDLAPGRYSAVHLVVLATETVEGTEFELIYSNSRVPRHADFASWVDEPTGTPAFMCLHRHTPTGDQRGRTHLTHLAMSASPHEDLTGIRLPENPALKILAITLEKAANSSQ